MYFYLLMNKDFIIIIIIIWNVLSQLMSFTIVKFFLHPFYHG